MERRKSTRKFGPRSLLAAALLATLAAMPIYASEPIDINSASAAQLAAAHT